MSLIVLAHSHGTMKFLLLWPLAFQPLVSATTATCHNRGIGLYPSNKQRSREKVVSQLRNNNVYIHMLYPLILLS